MKNYQPRKSGPGRKSTYKKGKTDKYVEVNPPTEPTGTKLLRKAAKHAIGKSHP